MCISRQSQELTVSRIYNWEQYFVAQNFYRHSWFRTLVWTKIVDVILEFACLSWGCLNTCLSGPGMPCSNLVWLMPLCGKPSEKNGFYLVHFSGKKFFGFGLKVGPELILRQLLSILQSGPALLLCGPYLPGACIKCCALSVCRSVVCLQFLVHVFVENGSIYVKPRLIWSAANTCRGIDFTSELSFCDTCL